MCFFELGYALKRLGWGQVIMILNEAFGPVSDLPFDLRMKRVGRRLQSGEGWHSNEHPVHFGNPLPRMPKEADTRCYACTTAYATMIRLCNVF